MGRVDSRGRERTPAVDVEETDPSANSRRSGRPKRTRPTFAIFTATTSRKTTRPTQRGQNCGGRHRVAGRREETGSAPRLRSLPAARRLRISGSRRLGTRARLAASEDRSGHQGELPGELVAGPGRQPVSNLHPTQLLQGVTAEVLGVHSIIHNKVFTLRVCVWLDSILREPSSALSRTTHTPSSYPKTASNSCYVQSVIFVSVTCHRHRAVLQPAN